MCHLQAFPARSGRKYGPIRRPELLVEWPRNCTFGFQGDQQDEEEETQMKKSESEVEVRASGTGQVRPAGAASVGPSLALTLCLCLQEAAAIIAQRPDNPREFFKQQERVASASAGSCDVPSPFNHRPGSPRSHPHLMPTPQVLALSLFEAPWKGSLAQGPLETARLFIKCASIHCLPGGRTEKAGVGGGRCWALAEQSAPR